MQLIEAPGYAGLEASPQEHDQLSAFILAHCPATEVCTPWVLWSAVTDMCIKTLELRLKCVCIRSAM